MCGRSSLTKTEKEIEARFKATFYTEELERYNPLPNYNMAPTQMLPVITGMEPEYIHIFRWGLIPFWAKDKSIGSKMINARIESLTSKPVFKNLLSTKRCIVPMDGFYEWKTSAKSKVPFRIVTTDQSIFSVAGLWDCWLSPENNENLHSFTIITQSPNELMETIHDRMPAILLPENERHWLDQHIPPEEALQLLMPYPAQNMSSYEVSPKVNNVRINEPSLIEPVLNYPKPFQSSLFE